MSKILWDFEASELRATIEGRRVYRKCPNCFGTGIERWEWDETESFPKRFITEQEETNLDPDKCGHEPCENCQTVGYIIAIHE